MKKALLIGIGGTYNYGCEAIVRGTVEILKERDPDYKIIYASYNVNDDKKRLKGCDIEIIKRPLRRWTLKNIFKKIVKKIGLNINYCYDSVSILEEIDEVYSIGGDIYTLGSDDNYSESLPLFGEKCIAKGIKYYLWGCSVGPFTKNKSAEFFFQKHLKNITKIYAREMETVDYLKTIGIESNVELMKDPAFYVAPEIKQDNKKSKIQKIGINLSPLSSLYFYSNLEEGIKMQIQTIKDLIDYYDCSIVLIPHVVSKAINDDDQRYLEVIYNRLSPKYSTKLELISNDPGFIGIKKELIRCDIVLAARMHCAINAISANIPVLFLSYSSKARGMAKCVYGNTDAVIGLSDFKIDIIREKISALYPFYK